MTAKGGKKPGKAAKDSMQTGVERFRTMFEEAPMGIALIDSLTGRIYEVNPRFAAIAGRSREEMAAIDWMSITHPDDVQEDLDNMALLNAGKIRGFHMNKRYRRPDGSYVWISMTIAPIKAEDARSPRHLCMIEDITERRKAEQDLAEKEERLRHLSDNLPDGLVYQIDSGVDGRSRMFTYISKSVEKMHGVTAAEAMRDPMKVYGQVVEKDRIMVAEREAAATAGMLPLIAEVQVRLPSGELRWRRFTSSPRRLPDRRIVWDGIELDITERKKAEEEIRRYQHNLEKMVEERTRELHEAHEKLARVERLASLGKFAGALSHELRNPIAVIMNAVSYLMMPGMHIDQAQNEEMLKVIQRQIEMAAMIIDNTLDFAQPKELVIQKGNINSVLENALAALTMPEGIVIEKKYESKTEIQADRNLMELACLNLIKNSIQACKSHGVIRIKTSDREGHVEMAIEDTGCGIAAVDMNKIFEPLFSRKPQGIGLGLYIVKGIVERHKGTISIKNNAGGKGVTVTVLLPAEARQ